MYAKQTIEEIVEVFKRGSVPGDDETFMQISDLFSLFYDDQEMNTDSTMVRGSDFCEMLALFFDLTDALRNNYLNQLDKRDDLINELQNSVAQQKVIKGKKGKKKKAISKKEKMEKSLNETLSSVQDNIRIQNLSDSNNNLLKQVDDLRQDLEKLVIQNEDKDIEIQQLQLELKVSQHKNYNYLESAKYAINDADEGLVKIHQLDAQKSSAEQNLEKMNEVLCKKS